MADNENNPFVLRRDIHASKREAAIKAAERLQRLGLTQKLYASHMAIASILHRHSYSHTRPQWHKTSLFQNFRISFKFYSEALTMASDDYGIDPANFNLETSIVNLALHIPVIQTSAFFTLLSTLELSRMIKACRADDIRRLSLKEKVYVSFRKNPEAKSFADDAIPASKQYQKGDINRSYDALESALKRLIELHNKLTLHGDIESLGAHSQIPPIPQTRPLRPKVLPLKPSLNKDPKHSK